MNGDGPRNSLRAFRAMSIRDLSNAQSMLNGHARWEHDQAKWTRELELAPDAEAGVSHSYGARNILRYWIATKQAD